MIKTSSKSYRKGYRFEKQVQKFYENLGYFVIRQGKSKFPDLILIPPRNINMSVPRFIECKYNKRPSKKELKKLKKFEEEYAVLCFVAIKKKGQKGFEIFSINELFENEEKIKTEKIFKT